MDAHKLSLNLKDHPEYASALAGASAGDTITLKQMTVIIDEIAQDQMIGSVDSCGEITVKAGPNSVKGATGEASEEAAAPVLAVMAPGYRKKK